MDHETVIGITISKIRDALGSAIVNHNIERQARAQTLEEIALREKYANATRKATVKDFTPDPNDTIQDIAKRNSENVEIMMQEKKTKINRKN